MVKQVRLWPVIVMLTALGIAALACTPSAANQPEPPEPAGSGGQSSDEQEAQANGTSSTGVQARTNQTANIREKPDPNCPILGSVPRNQEINLLIRTTSTTEQWYQTDYLGEDNPGWVYHESLTLLDDDSGLPRVAAEGCANAAAPAASCGDGTCNSGETCQTCTADCGTCPLAPGACPAGPGNCCGDGTCQTDEDASWCGDCAQVTASCGNGVVEAGEECDPPEPEPSLPPGGGSVSWCSDACTMSAKTGGGGIPSGCGNNSCEPGEDTCSCPNDCPGTCVTVADPCAVNPLGPDCIDPCLVLGTC